jgi:hypothetical protein
MRTLTWIEEMEWIIKSIYDTEKEFAARVKTDRPRLYLLSMTKMWRKTLAENGDVKALLEMYSKARSEKAKKDLAPDRKSKQELSLERCFTAAQAFLGRYVEAFREKVEGEATTICGVPKEVVAAAGEVSGFEGHGLEAARTLLQDGAEIIERKRDVQEVRSVGDISVHAGQEGDSKLVPG